MKHILSTTYGDIEIIENQNINFPGITIRVADKDIALVELNKMNEVFQAYLWNDTDEDFAHKETYLPPVHKGVSQYASAQLDIESVLEERFLDEEDNTPELTRDQLESLIHRVIRYDYADYNDYIAEQISELLGLSYD